MTTEQWESLCKQCGKCCFAKIDLGGGKYSISYKHPCRHLNLETRTCNVYPDRFNKAPNCKKLIPLEIPRIIGWLPMDCGYVENYLKGKDADTR